MRRSRARRTSSAASALAQAREPNRDAGLFVSPRRAPPSPLRSRPFQRYHCAAFGTSMSAPIRHHDAGELAAGYARSHRALELFGIAALALLSIVQFVRIARIFSSPVAWALPVGIFVGMFGADIVSGLVHWGCDTWGSPTTPVIGPIFIRTFREHHVDAMAITRHDFVETNGSNCLVSAPVLGLALFVPARSGERLGLLVAVASVSFCLFVFVTSQIHKWSHMVTPPRVVGWLQRSRVILSREHHDRHHVAPFDRCYAITTGWSNVLFDGLGAFRSAERWITAITGALPRQDDIGVVAAIAVAEEHGIVQTDTATDPRAAFPGTPRVG